MVLREHLFQLATLVVVGASLLALIAVAPEYPEARIVGRGFQDFADLSERFVTIAKKKGAVYAFEVLRRAELPPNTDLHLLGHVVGDELYREKSVQGIAECTQDFRNACSHSIVIGALNEFGGEEALSLIREACREAPGGSGAYTMCYHGLGHGVFAYFGYSLPETVEFCKKTGTEESRNREYIECVGGSVMELMGGGGHDREKWLFARERYLTADPLSPCMDSLVPNETREICLTYLTPRLWELKGIDLGVPDPSRFPDAFALCEGIPEGQQRLRDACFGGFGKEFIVLAGARDIRRITDFTDEEFANAIGWCEAASAEDGRSACIKEGLDSVFWGGENDPQSSFRFCGLVHDQDMQSACYHELAINIAHYLPDRSELCVQLPSAQHSICLKERF